MMMMGVYENKFLDLKPQSRLYEFLVQIKELDFSFYYLYISLYSKLVYGGGGGQKSSKSCQRSLCMAQNGNFAKVPFPLRKTAEVLTRRVDLRNFYSKNVTDRFIRDKFS